MIGAVAKGCKRSLCFRKVLDWRNGQNTNSVRTAVLRWAEVRKVTDSDMHTEDIPRYFDKQNIRKVTSGFANRFGTN